MRLYIMRHGPAEDRAISGRDFDRALTPSGRERVRDVARALHEAGESPALILTSPLVRALQTAEIVAAMSGAVVEVNRAISPDEGALPLVEERLAAGSDRLMLVGHEPDLADLASRLSGRSFSGGLQKAMVVGLTTGDTPASVDPGTRSIAGTLRLRFVLDPKSLAWLDDAR